MYSRATEEAIIMYLHDYYLIQLDELNHPDLKLEFSKAPCTIYFVCSRPRLSINTTYYKINRNGIQLEFNAHIQEEKIPFLVNVEIEYDFSELKIESEYPYNFFCLRTPDGEIFGGGKTVHFVEKYKDRSKSYDFLDSEVLYIGQSLDLNEELPLKKRLLNHNTLQKIYAEVVKNCPDKEIYILLASFDQNNFLHIPGNIKLSENNKKIDFIRTIDMIQNPSKFTLEQRTNFTEAGLIKYFKPTYNSNFKVNFPDVKHKSYRECYDLDVSQLTIEIDTEDSGYRLYSDSVGRRWNHVARYHMSTSEDRRKMFEGLFGD